jgi:hypothetical protein
MINHIKLAIIEEWNKNKHGESPDNIELEGKWLCLMTLSDNEYNNYEYPDLKPGMAVAKVNSYNLRFGPKEEDYYALANPVEVMRRHVS